MNSTLSHAPESNTNEQKQILKADANRICLLKKRATYDTPELSGNLACRADWEAGHCFLDCGSNLTLETAARPCHSIRLLLTLPSGYLTLAEGCIFAIPVPETPFPETLFTCSLGTRVLKCRIFSNQSCLIHALWIWRNRPREGKCFLQVTQ